MIILALVGLIAVGVIALVGCTAIAIAIRSRRRTRLDDETVPIPLPQARDTTQHSSTRKIRSRTPTPSTRRPATFIPSAAPTPDMSIDEVPVRGRRRQRGQLAEPTHPGGEAEVTAQIDEDIGDPDTDRDPTPIFRPRRA